MEAVLMGVTFCSKDDFFFIFVKQHENQLIACLLREHVHHLTGSFRSYVTKEQQQRLKSTQGVTYITETLEACGNTGLGIYTSLLALIIEEEIDFSIVTTAIKAAGKLCYDDGKIIDAMEVLSRKPNFKTNTMLQKEFCKTLYEICRFMGKPVTLDKGKNILVYLLTSSLNEEIKTFARETMEKIIALQL